MSSAVRQILWKILSTFGELTNRKFNKAIFLTINWETLHNFINYDFSLFT
jgi:hypothetical protein